MALSTQQRRKRILGELYENGHVSVKTLAGGLDVSEATVRRDLRALAGGGQVELVYGGANLRRGADYSFRSKSMLNVQAKRVIGRLAAGLVSDGEQIFLDSGTTCFEIVPLLKLKRGLLVIVNSARLALEMDSPGLNMILLGGNYRCDRMDTVGPLTIGTLEQLRGYIAFIGADGLSMDFGLTAGDIESAHLYRQALANAREGILLADSTKFQSPSLYKIVDWDAISRVVTDTEPSQQWAEFFASREIKVLYPEKQQWLEQT